MFSCFANYKTSPVLIAPRQKDLVELFLANKADINAKDNGGLTPLAWAVQQKHNDVADFLRQHGAK